MKKILIIGPEYFGINESISNAFMEFGFETKVFNFSESYPVNYKTKITHGVFNKLGFSYFIDKYNNQINEEIVEIYTSYKPDIVLIIKGHKIYKKTLMIMEGSNLVLWMMDSVTRVPVIFDTINLYDFVYVFEEDDVGTLAQNGVKSYHLPLALDKRRYKPNLDFSNQYIDIIFIGSLYQGRIDTLKHIIKTYPNKKIIIRGFFPSWLVNLKNISLRFGKYKKYFSIGSVSPEEINNLYSQSKIVLNLHFNYSLSGCNLRFFEIAGTKRIQIVNRKRIIDKEFNMMEPLVFDNREELLMIIQNVFEGKIDSGKIVEDVYNKIIENHTYENRVEEILKRLSLMVEYQMK